MIKKIKDKILGLDEHILEVLKKSSSSTIVKLLGMGAGFLVSISLSRFLGPDGVGIIYLSSRIVSIILILVLLGIPQVIVKEVSIAKFQRRWKHIGDVMYTSYLMCGLLTVAVSVLFILLSPWIANSIFNEERLIFPLIMSFIALTPRVFSRLFSSALIGYRKIWQSNLVDQTLSVVVIGILLLVLYLMDVEITINLVVVIYVIARLVVTLTVGFYWQTLYSHKLEKTNIRKKLLKTSLPLMLVSTTVIISSSIDSIMIGWFADTRQVGIYNIAVNLALLSSFFLQVSASVLSPMISSLFEEKKNR
jgi:O-antigen/teichoic acid export membrane protein